MLLVCSSYAIRHFTNVVELICNSQPFFRSRFCHKYWLQYFPNAFYYILSSSWRVSQRRKWFPIGRIPETIFFQNPRNLRKSGEPTWLRLAQGLLLSPPSLGGDRLKISYLRLGQRAIQAFVLSLGSGNVTLCWVAFCCGFLAVLEEQPVFSTWSYEDGPVMYWYKIWFRLGILNLVAISVLSTHGTACLAKDLGHVDDAMWELEKRGRLFASGYLVLFLYPLFSV